jgi:ACR3 family arsenite transporter
MSAPLVWLERHQVALYVGAILAGVAGGLVLPGSAPVLSVATAPLLALLLLATFLGMPLIEVGRAFRGIRFLGAVLIVNFAVVPAIAFGLSRFVADDAGLLTGALLVLLTPCVDYVIVFAGLAGGARARLLAATPVLMLLQIVLLPAFLWLFAGTDAAAFVDPAPFVEAFAILIVLPLAAAALIQLLGRRHRIGRRIEQAFTTSVGPLMMATLAVVVASQIAAVGREALTLLRVIPLYAAFLVIMLVIGLVGGCVARLPVGETRALVFSGATRNSLVVLPLALALPAQLAIAPLAVVTQTLVEIVGMVVFIRVVPALTRRGDVSTVKAVESAK